MVLVVLQVFLMGLVELHLLMEVFMAEVVAEGREMYPGKLLVLMELL
jgi:hypothetical protein